MEINNLDWDKAAKIFAPEKEAWEQKVKRGMEKYPLAKDLLKILAVGGVFGLAIIAPGLLVTIGREAKWQERSRFNQRLARLKKRKLINVYYKNGKPVVEITKDGLEKALEYKFADMKIKTPRKWDKKWRLVIFDVANDKRQQRDRLREKLKEMGFLALNESVLIYPYPCADEIEFIRQVFELGEEVTYLVADRFEGDDYYHRSFFREE